jgi:integrase/recombinase XerD
MLASLSVVLDTRRIKSKTKNYPLKLRVTYDRKSRYYPTIYDLKEEDTC